MSKNIVRWVIIFNLFMLFNPFITICYATSADEDVEVTTGTSVTIYVTPSNNSQTGNMEHNSSSNKDSEDAAHNAEILAQIEEKYDDIITHFVEQELFMDNLYYDGSIYVYDEILVPASQRTVLREFLQDVEDIIPQPGQDLVWKDAYDKVDTPGQYKDKTEQELLEQAGASGKTGKIGSTSSNTHYNGSTGGSLKANSSGIHENDMPDHEFEVDHNVSLNPKKNQITITYPEIIEIPEHMEQGNLIRQDIFKHGLIAYTTYVQEQEALNAYLNSLGIEDDVRIYRFVEYRISDYLAGTITSTINANRYTWQITNATTNELVAKKTTVTEWVNILFPEAGTYDICAWQEQIQTQANVVCYDINEYFVLADTGEIIWQRSQTSNRIAYDEDGFVVSVPKMFTNGSTTMRIRVSATSLAELWINNPGNIFEMYNTQRIS